MPLIVRNLTLRPWQQRLFLALLLGIALSAGLSSGAYRTSIQTVATTLARGLSANDDAVYYLIWHIRLPRLLLAALVGAGLSVTGAAIQGVFRNPLAEPSLIGITSGAMLAAVVAIVSLSGWLGAATAVLHQSVVALFAFGGGLATTYLVYRLSTRQGRTDVTTMLLAGIAITALAGAITGLLITSSDDEQLRDITFWSLGSCSGASWGQVAVVAPVVVVGTFMVLRHAKALNAILLGEKEALYLGFEVERIKRQIVFWVALMVGACIAMTGIIGFVGLIVPHFLRLIVGVDYRQLLPLSALLGAAFLVQVDTWSRTWLAPTELPIGVLTAIVGSPFFIWLLLRWQRQQRP